MQSRDFFKEQNKKQVNQPAMRDFFAEQVEPKEKFSESLYNAPGRVLTDIYHAGLNTFNKIPEYWKTAKTEVPGLLNTINNIPSQSPENIAARESLLRQGKAGLPELQMKAVNMIPDISNYFSDRLHLLPNDINNKIQMMRMPENTQQKINEKYGVPKRPGEALLRGMTRNLDVEIPGASLLKGTLGTAKNVFNKVHPQKVIESIQGHHDLMKSTAGNLFTKVGSQVGKRNVPSFPIRPDLVDDIADHLKYLKSTPTGKQLVIDAKNGNYEALRTLQTDLFDEANNFSSPLSSGSDKQIAKVLRNYRREINDTITKHLDNTGHKDLAADINQARRIYADMQKTYYGKKTPAAIKNMVNPESRKIPKNIMNTLREQSIPMARIKKNNPFALKQSSKYEKKLNAIKNLKNLYKATKIAGGTSLAGLGGAGLYYGPEIYHALTDKK